MKTQELNPDKKSVMTDQLLELFEFADPNSLRRSIHFILFNYLNQKDLVLPENFDIIIEDFYFLIKFLQDSEDLMDGKTTPNSKRGVIFAH